MHEDLCGTCDMPMMEYAKSICCVLCKEKVIEEEIAEEEVDEEKVEDSGVPEVEEVAQEAANQHGNESLEDSKETDANQTSELPKENKEVSLKLSHIQNV